MSIFDIVPVSVLASLALAFAALFCFRFLLAFAVYVFKNLLYPRGSLRNASRQKSFGVSRSVSLSGRKFTKGGLSCKRF
jgi:hypothetical protein